jgi:hypothetical protein
MLYFQVAKTVSVAYVADCSGLYAWPSGTCGFVRMMRIAALLQNASWVSCCRETAAEGSKYVFSKAGS